MANETPSARRGALRYVITWLALIVLTAVSFGVAGLDLGALGTGVALGIASVKALIVMLVFMHLAEESMSERIVAAVAVAFIVLLCLGIYADVAYR